MFKTSTRCAYEAAMSKLIRSPDEQISLMNFKGNRKPLAFARADSHVRSLAAKLISKTLRTRAQTPLL